MALHTLQPPTKIGTWNTMSPALAQNTFPRHAEPVGHHGPSVLLLASFPTFQALKFAIINLAVHINHGMLATIEAEISSQRSSAPTLNDKLGHTGSLWSSQEGLLPADHVTTEHAARKDNISIYSGVYLV